jgi:phosphonate transport system substrate-binding protein
VYFSDVVVRSDSRFQSFADLRGARWAINEPSSQSGCGVVRYHLATLGETRGFFGSVIQSGAHQMSLRMILAGKIDASAIDSTVLEQEFENHPALRSRVRLIGALGPSPIPPWVISNRVPLPTRRAVRGALLNMHTDPEGQAILAPGGWARFAPVTDKDYDPIRQMAQTAQAVQW